MVSNAIKLTVTGTSPQCSGMSLTGALDEAFEEDDDVSDGDDDGGSIVTVPKFSVVLNPGSGSVDGYK